MIKSFLMGASAVALLTACTPTDNSKTAEGEKKIFRYNQTGGLKSLDPANAGDRASVWATSQLFNGLMELDENLHPRPALAESYEEEVGQYEWNSNTVNLKSANGEAFVKDLYARLSSETRELCACHNIILSILVTGSVPYSLENSYFRTEYISLLPFSPKSVIEFLQAKELKFPPKLSRMLDSRAFRDLLEYLGVVPFLVPRLISLLEEVCSDQRFEQAEVSGVCQYLCVVLSNLLYTKGVCNSQSPLMDSDFLASVCYSSLLRTAAPECPALYELRRLGCVLGWERPMVGFAPKMAIPLVKALSQSCLQKHPALQVLKNFEPFGLVETKAELCTGARNQRFVLLTGMVLLLRANGIRHLKENVSFKTIFPGLTSIPTPSLWDYEFGLSQSILESLHCAELSQLGKKLVTRTDYQDCCQNQGLYLAEDGQTGWDIIDTRFESVFSNFILLIQAKEYSGSIAPDEYQLWVTEAVKVANYFPDSSVVAVIVSASPLQGSAEEHVRNHLKPIEKDLLSVKERLAFFRIDNPESRSQFALAGTEFFFN